MGVLDGQGAKGTQKSGGCLSVPVFNANYAENRSWVIQVKLRVIFARDRYRTKKR